MPETTPTLSSAPKPTLLLSKYLNYANATKASVPNVPDATQTEALKAWGIHIFDPICEHFVTPPFLHSVFRCKAYNTLIGGDPKSQHMNGEAGDLDYDDVTKTITNKQLFDWVAQNLDFDQMIWESGDTTNPGWVHISYVTGRPNRKKLTRYITAGGKKQYVDFDLYKFPIK